MVFYEKVNNIIKNYPYDDYPFSSIESYYKCLIKTLNTVYFDEIYPNYGHYFYCQHPGETDADIFKKIFNKNKQNFTQSDIQDYLDMFLEIFIVNHRYSKSLFKCCGEDIVKFLIDNGARINFDILFDGLDRELIYKENSFEDDISGFDIRGLLIDILVKYMYVDLDKYGDWINIKATYFGNLLSDNNHYILEKKYDIKIARRMVLKYESKFLQLYYLLLKIQK